MDIYYGTYARFNTLSKKDAAALTGADNLVGDSFTIEFEAQKEINGNMPTAWIVNKFGKRIGYLSTEQSRILGIYEARNFTLTALLSFVAYTDRPDPGEYWGEVALICFNSSYHQEFEKFSRHISEKLCDGIRPNLSFGEQGCTQIIETNGSWTPSGRVPFPEKQQGTVILKKQRNFSEKLIEQGRKGNKGCYIVSWAFLFAVVAGLVVLLKSCNVF